MRTAYFLLNFTVVCGGTRCCSFHGGGRCLQTLKLTSDDEGAGNLFPARRLFSQVLERFSLELAILLQQDFHLAFRLFQFLAAGRG